MDLTLRPATPADVAAIGEAFGEEPSEEQLAVAGDAARARRFRQLMLRQLTSGEALQRTSVAVVDGRAVGFLQAGIEAGERISPRLAWGVLRIFGLRGIRGFLQRDRLRANVHLQSPPATFHIAEVHVRKEVRGLGVGAALLADAERQAKAAGAARMSLTTATNNPARRLYERFGFRVEREATDVAYEALTGVPGRVLMVKPLT